MKLFNLFKHRQVDKLIQVVDPQTNKWYGLDKNFNVWISSEDQTIDLCITTCSHLLVEGEVRELARKISEMRKTLNLKPNDPLPTVQ